MIEESALVVATEGEDAWVETSRRSSCGSCEAKGCGTGTLSQVLGRRSQRLRVKNPIAAVAGERVVLGISESALIKGSLAVYLVPLLALMSGGLLGELMASQLMMQGEGITILFALASLGLSLLWLRRFNRRAVNDTRFNAAILRRVDVSISENISFNLNK
ncbi:MAG: SoxR reducing system RseC family protein [Pseudomonadota bacterium]